jgi:hypothetical protein
MQNGTAESRTDGTTTPESNKIRCDPRDVDRHFWHHRAGTHDDIRGVTVKSILLKTHEHIVFLDENNNLQWECSAETQVRACYPKIANRVASLEARSEFLRRAHSITFLRTAGMDNDLANTRRLIAQGIIQVLVDMPGSEQAEDHANDVLNTAEAWIDQRAIEVSRLWFFRPFSVLVGACFIILFLFLTVYSKTPKIDWALPLACMAAGGIGAFISSAIGCAERIPSAASAGQRLHVLEAAIRWSVGLGAGALVYLVTKSDLMHLFPIVKTDPESVNFAMLAAALLAGASERFFPSLIKKLDDPEMRSNHQSSKKSQNGEVTKRTNTSGMNLSPN